MPLLNVNQINPSQFALAVQLYSSGAAFSGNFVNYVQGGGWLGNNVVATTGGLQHITGIKIFDDSPRVPYSGGTGVAPSTQWVLDQLSSSSAGVTASINSLSGFTTGASGALSYVRVTGSSTIRAANFTGLGGTLVIYSGGQIFISGAAGGGGGSNVLVTGSSAITSANFTGVDAITVTYDGTYVRISGSSAGNTPNVVTTTGNEVIGGFKQFTGSPFVPAPTQPSGAANLAWTSGVSGDLYARMTGISGAIIAGNTTVNNYYITGTGVVAASSTGTVTNTFNITSGTASVSSSGTVNNTFNGTVNNSISISQPTGNFVNMPFWFDAFSLGTGLNQIENIIGRSFFFTGYAIAVINSGTQGFFSGSFYQRTTTNAKTNFLDLSLNSGVLFYASGGYAQEVSGLNRVGIDIYRIGTGITGLSIGLFGVGY